MLLNPATLGTKQRKQEARKAKRNSMLEIPVLVQGIQQQQQQQQQQQ